MLDSLNALSYGLPDCQINKLQQIQNQAAKLVARKRKCDYVTHIFVLLHWLLIKYRIRYKIPLLTFKCFKGIPFITDEDSPSCTLRSSGKLLLKQKKVRLSSYGERTFSIAAPCLWNRLPEGIRRCKTNESFKCSLKTHFFRSD